MTKLLIPALLNLFLLSTLVMADNNTKYGINQTSFDFPDCPDTPNCVSSLAVDPGKRVEPFPIKGDFSRSMKLLAGIINSMPRTYILSATDERIEAEFRSLLGFVDDVLFAYSLNGNVIHVRSASRKGSWDMGVNRRRVEKIRKTYLEMR